MTISTDSVNATTNAYLPEEEVPYAWTNTAGFDPSAGSGYISSGELLAWLALTTGNTYDDMRWHMMGTEARRDLTKMLTELKSLLQRAKEDGAVAGDVHAKAQAILDQFGSGTRGLLDPGTEGMLGNIAGVAEESRVDTYMQSSESWITHLDGTITSLGTSDQLALIKIQELNGQISQATQLASNMIAAQDQTLNATIMNIKA
ncbi:MAG: hypothetical protein DIU78_000785 [Pseudomonadota bacterium]|nr:MAG: hypothetical protein DIU78_11725 [Pseudomonadota bacterium]